MSAVDDARSAQEANEPRAQCLSGTLPLTSVRSLVRSETAPTLASQCRSASFLMSHEGGVTWHLQVDLSGSFGWREPPSQPLWLQLFFSVGQPHWCSKVASEQTCYSHAFSGTLCDSAARPSEAAKQELLKSFSWSLRLIGRPQRSWTMLAVPISLSQYLLSTFLEVCWVV